MRLIPLFLIAASLFGQAAFFGSNVSQGTPTFAAVSGANVCAQSTLGATFTSTAKNFTGANLIVLVVSDYTSDSTTITDSSGNTYAPLTAQTNATSSARNRIVYKANPTVSSSMTFTGTPASASFAAFCAIGFSGAASSPFDQQNGTSNQSSTPLATGSVTPSVGGELLVTGMGGTGTASNWSINSSFTILGTESYVPSNSYGVGMAYKIKTALDATAENPQWADTTATVTSATTIATFKP